MKRLLLLLALMGIVAVGCSKEEIDKGDENAIPENIFFGIDKENVTISPDGGSVDIVVYSNYKWEISGTSDWCTPSVTTGDANEDGQKVTFTADVTYDDREATFWFRCADEKIKLVVLQKLKAVIIPDANNTFDIPAEGGIAAISYKTNVDCEVVVPEDAQDWITIVPATRGLVSENINLDIAENKTYDPRSAVIKVVAKDNAELVLEYTINQEQNNAILADENNTFTVPSAGGEVVIKYQTNINCDFIIPEEAQDWITIAPATRGLVSCDINLDILENTTYSARTAVIKVVARDNAKLVVEYTINQEQNNALLTDENNTFTVPSAGGKVEIKYQTNVDCEVIIPEEAQDWITIAPATRGLVSECITLNIAENKTCDPRSAVIKVVAKDNAELVVEYTINQEQNNALLTDEKNTFTVPSAGGKVEIKYQTNVDCEVIIPEDAKDWITIAPATRGLVSENINLDIAENKKYDPRSAVIKVVAKDNAELVVEYTINQEQNNALLTDENNTFTVPSAGGKVEIKYQTNVDCEVIIPEDAKDWITIAPATRGLVSECITLNIAENKTCDPRSAVIKVVAKDNANITIEYTINQKPKYCIYYTSSNGKIVTPNSSLAFGATILSNTYEDGVGEIEFNAPITKIGYAAFSNCSSLTSVTIPNSVTTIGDLAFFKCSSLTSVTIPNSVTTIENDAFSNCSSLASVTIGNSVTTIGKSAFSGCSSLTSVTIPNSVTSIGDYAFSNCSSLTSITIPDSVTTIEKMAFYECSSLTSVTIGASVTTIGDWAFSGCSSLTSVTIPDSVTSIGYLAFSGCSSLTSVTIGDSVTSIGAYAFEDCSSLTSVTIGASVTTIGEKAFYNCSGLTSITIPDSVTSIGEYAFCRCLSLTSVTIGASVTTIGGHAFCQSKIESITIPDSVTSIGDWAFSGCSSLTSVTIPNSVTTIENDAFHDCSSLTSVTIGDSVTSIGENTFCRCLSLTSVYCKPTTPPAGGDDMFALEASGRKIYVPMESVSEYKSASYWSDYADAIVGYNF